MTNPKSSNYSAEKQTGGKDLKISGPKDQKNLNDGSESKGDVPVDVEEKQIVMGASGDSMEPAPSTKDDENYGKGKNIPTSPSGLV